MVDVAYIHQRIILKKDLAGDVTKQFWFNEMLLKQLLS